MRNVLSMTSTLVAVLLSSSLILLAGCPDRQQTDAEPQAPAAAGLSGEEDGPQEAERGSAPAAEIDSIRAALADSRPKDGARVSGEELLLSWQPPHGLPEGGRLHGLVRSGDEEDWRRIEAGDPRRVVLADVEEGETYSYRLVFVDGESEEQGPIARVSITSGPHFELRRESLEIERDLERRHHLTVINPTENEQRLHLRVESAPSDLILGFVGTGSRDADLVLEPGGRAAVPLALFPQDARPGLHPCVVSLSARGEEGPVEDHLALDVSVVAPDFDLDVSTRIVDPLTLATTVIVRNRGQALSDLTISPSHESAGRIRLLPQVRHARLGPGDVLSFEVQPRLQRGDRRVEAAITLRAAGQSIDHPLVFSVPEDKEVFVATTHSTVTDSAQSWFCTNRPDIREDIHIEGTGAARGTGQPGGATRTIDVAAPEAASIPPDQPIEAPRPSEPPPPAPEPEPPLPFEDLELEPQSPPSVFDRLERIGEKLWKLISIDKGTPIVGRGIRGGVVREPVARHFPGLETDGLEAAHALVQEAGKAQVWHTREDGSHSIEYAAILEDGTKIGPLALVSSPDKVLWPTLAGSLEDTLIVAWEQDDGDGSMEIHLRRSTDGGRTWGAPIQQTEHGEGAFDPVLWTGGGSWALAWEDGRGGIYLRRSEDDGRSWLAEQRIAEGRAAWPQLAGDADDLHCVFTLDDRVMLVESADGGGSFSEPERISASDSEAGEPSIALADGVVHVAWRAQVEEDESAVWYRRRVEGSWSDPSRLSHEDAAYGEYPQLWASTEGYTLLSYVAPSLDQGFEYIRESNDGGLTWTPAGRLARRLANVEKAFFITDFSLPWDLSKYRPHDVDILVNEERVAHLSNTVPEGRYIYPVDVGMLRHHPDRPARNRVRLATTHLNGGHYVINSGFTFVQFLTHQELMVVAESQRAADLGARRRFGPEVNHDRPDAALFANLVKGLPEDTTEEATITLEVTVVNLGPVALPATRLEAAWIDREGSSPAAEPVEVHPIGPARSRTVSLGFEHDGKARTLRLRVAGHGLDASRRNDFMDLRLGRHHEGEIELSPHAEAEYLVRSAGLPDERGSIAPGETLTLPVGSYDLMDSDGALALANVAVRGGEITLADPEEPGYLTVMTPSPMEVVCTDENGREYRAESNSQMRLAPGFYTVNAPRDDSLVFDEVTVRSMSRVMVHPEQHGWVRVTFPGSRELMEIIDQHGDSIASGYRRDRIRVPPGTYSVRSGAGINSVPVEATWVQVAPGATTEVVLEAGSLEIPFFTGSSSGMYIKAKIFDQEGNEVISSFVNTEVILPRGDYQIELLGRRFEASVSSQEHTEAVAPGLGGVRAAGFDGSWMQVFDPDGTQVGRVIQGVGAGLVVKTGTYSVTVGETRLENVVVKENEWTELRPSQAP